MSDSKSDSVESVCLSDSVGNLVNVLLSDWVSDSMSNSLSDSVMDWVSYSMSDSVNEWGYVSVIHWMSRVWFSDSIIDIVGDLYEWLSEKGIKFVNEWVIE